MAEDKKPGTAVVTWREKMLKVQSQAVAMSAPKGGFFSFKGGRLSYDDTPVPGDKINVIIVDFALENKWFPAKYDPRNTAPPACYALGKEESELAPHADAADPQGSEDGLCEGCPKNEWGSNPEGGRGKWCQNSRRVAVIPADVLKAEDPVSAIKKANIVMANIPVTSVKLFSKAINQVVQVLGVPPFGVVVELSVTPSDTLFSVNWKVMEQITGDEIMAALMAKYEQAEKLVMAPYPKPEDAAPSAPASTKY